MSHLPRIDPRFEKVLDLFSREARIERSRLRLAARPDELGLSGLALALVLFEIEDRFDIHLPQPHSGAAELTLHELVSQVIDCLDRKPALSSFA